MPEALAGLWSSDLEAVLASRRESEQAASEKGLADLQPHKTHSCQCHRGWRWGCILKIRCQTPENRVGGEHLKGLQEALLTQSLLRVTPAPTLILT